MKKILMIGFTPPEEGGSERHIYELASRIKDVNVLTQKGSICKNKIEIPLIKKPYLLRNVLFLFLSFIFSFYLLIRKRYHIIHIHENLLYFLVPLLRLRYKVIVTIHGIRGFKFYNYKFLWFFFKLPLKFVHKIICVSIADKKILRKYFNNVVYIPNGVDISLYSRIRAKVRKKITFIGRIHEQKGIIYLLKAFELVNKRYPNFKLEIIGKINDYAKDLQKKFPSKNIIWRGFVGERKEIITLLKSSYCIVLPSLWEGLPLTFLESLASGRPVIVSDIYAFKSITNKEAIFFKSKNYKELSKKILYLIKNKKLAEKIGRKGKKLAKKYDWNLITRKLEKVYKNVIKK